MTHDPAREPIRTCVGCRRRAPAPELVRLRRGVGGLEVGPGDGRGAWLCAPPAGLACLDEAAKRGALARALRATISADDVARVRARLDGCPGAGARPGRAVGETRERDRTGRATRGDEEDQDLRAGS